MKIDYKLDCQDVNWGALRDALIADQFDNGRTTQQYQLSFDNSYSVVFAYDNDQIVGTARALSDGVCNAYVVDVWTASAYRKQGIARAMMQHLLESLQGQHVYLWTDDMQAFYRAIGMHEAKDHTGFYQVVGDWLQNDSRNL